MRKEFIFAIAMAMSGTAFAADNSSGSADMSNWDANSDGSVSQDEFYGGISDAGLYPDWDMDNDGLIDENEFAEIGIDEDYDTWDVNEDGYLDSGEFYDGTYSYYDENEDGHWDDGEWDDAGDAGWFDV